MRLHVLSDLHLEFGDFQLPPVAADVVVAAGDIGIGTDGARWLGRIGRPVVYVAGNHEYYGGEIGEVNRAIAAQCVESGVHFLDNREVVIDGVRFLGATLWSDFAGADPALMTGAQSAMNDYAQIRCGPQRTLVAADTLEFNRTAREWLEGALARPHAGPTVIVTHHAPSQCSCSAGENPVYLAAYCNRLDDLVARCGAAAWIHGHVHARADYRIGRPRVVCNPRGYDGLLPVEGFDPGLVIEI
jgi:Icc-related predicted phosphoesterase